MRHRRLDLDSDGNKIKKKKIKDRENKPKVKHIWGEEFEKGGSREFKRESITESRKEEKQEQKRKLREAEGKGGDTAFVLGKGGVNKEQEQMPNKEQEQMHEVQDQGDKDQEDQDWEVVGEKKVIEVISEESAENDE